MKSTLYSDLSGHHLYLAEWLSGVHLWKLRLISESLVSVVQHSSTLRRPEGVVQGLLKLAEPRLADRVGGGQAQRGAGTPPLPRPLYSVAKPNFCSPSPAFPHHLSLEGYLPSWEAAAFLTLVSSSEFF